MKINANQRKALFYVDRYQDDDYGVIVHTMTGQALIDKGLAKLSRRRFYSRGEGICIGLTEAGYQLCRSIDPA